MLADRLTFPSAPIQRSNLWPPSLVPSRDMDNDIVFACAGGLPLVVRCPAAHCIILQKPSPWPSPPSPSSPQRPRHRHRHHPPDALAIAIIVQTPSAWLGVFRSPLLPLHRNHGQRVHNSSRRRPFWRPKLAARHDWTGLDGELRAFMAADPRLGRETLGRPAAVVPKFNLPATLHHESSLCLA